jgi:hypothetical protein
MTCPITPTGQHKFLVWAARENHGHRREQGIVVRSGRSCRFCHKTWEWVGNTLMPTYP